MISLNRLLAGLCEPLALDIEIERISMDSREMQTAGLFIASAKQSAMRQQHVDQAVNSGAKAIVIDDSHSVETTVPVLKITDLDQNISLLGDRFYDQPSKSMTVIAVTGTNGKTSVSQFIAQSLESLAIPCGVIGTLGQGRINQLHDTGMTTPSPLQLQRVLAEMQQQGIKHVVLEASSHALEQGRLNAVDIDIAVFTNLSRDHLDYHGDMAAYAAAKQRLFTFASVNTAIFNIDDNYGQQFYAQPQSHISHVSYSQSQTADWQASELHCDNDGLHFALTSQTKTAQIDSTLLGRFNVDNLLATAAVLNALGYQFAVIAKCLTAVKPVTGRMQLLREQNSPSVVVDYAHTPDAIAQALTAMRQHLNQSAALWCVFGCGGDRDTGKRPLMGEQAEQHADRLVLTDDNPRSESSKSIIEDILSGLQQPESALVKTDRREAIFYAVAEAANDDMILVAGKGHETYQEKQGQKQPFNDIAVVMEAQAARQQQAGVNL